MEIEQAVVEFIVEKNEAPGSGFAVVENPGHPLYEVVRSPFTTEQEARDYAIDLGKYWGYEAREKK